MLGRTERSQAHTPHVPTSRPHRHRGGGGSCSRLTLYPAGSCNVLQVRWCVPTAPHRRHALLAGSGRVSVTAETGGLLITVITSRPEPVALDLAGRFSRNLQARNIVRVTDLLPTVRSYADETCSSQEGQAMNGWRKSSYSTGPQTNCVEIASTPRQKQVGVRDSNDQDGPVLRFPDSAWERFTRDLKGARPSGDRSCWPPAKRTAA